MTVLQDRDRKEDNGSNDSFSHLILGETCREVSLSSESAMISGTMALVSQGRINVKMFCHDLEPVLYDNERFVKEVARIATSHRNASIDVLIQDPTPALKNGHRLVTLYQRLTSYINIRRVSRDFLDNTESFIMVDELGMLFRPHRDRWQGWLNVNAGPTIARWHSFFNSAWELAEPEQNFRRLHI